MLPQPLSTWFDGYHLYYLLLLLQKWEIKWTVGWIGYFGALGKKIGFLGNTCLLQVTRKMTPLILDGTQVLLQLTYRSRISVTIGSDNWIGWPDLTPPYPCCPHLCWNWEFRNTKLTFRRKLHSNLTQSSSHCSSNHNDRNFAGRLPCRSAIIFFIGFKPETKIVASRVSHDFEVGSQGLLVIHQNLDEYMLMSFTYCMFCLCF